VKGNLKITREVLTHLELWHSHTIFEFEKLSFRSKDSEIGHIMTRMLELLNLSIKCETFSLDSIMEYKNILASLEYDRPLNEKKLGILY